MKTDYTITPEFDRAILEAALRLHVDNQRWIVEQMIKSENIGEPFVRTVGNIAARILFVLLLVGTLVGVML